MQFKIHQAYCSIILYLGVLLFFLSRKRSSGNSDYFKSVPINCFSNQDIYNLKSAAVMTVCGDYLRGIIQQQDKYDKLGFSSCPG